MVLDAALHNTQHYEVMFHIATINAMYGIDLNVLNDRT